MQTSNENITLLTSSEDSNTVFMLNDVIYRFDGIHMHQDNSGRDGNAVDIGDGYENLVFSKGRDTLLAKIGCYPLSFR